MTMHTHGGMKRWLSVLDMTTGFWVSVGYRRQIW